MGSFKDACDDNRFPRWLSGKESACNAKPAGDTGSIPESGRSLGEGNGNPPQYVCLGNPMDKGAWWATVHGITHTHTHTHTHMTVTKQEQFSNEDITA